MRVFVSEFLIGGGASQPVESMSREAHAMLTSVITDIMRLPGYSVVTTLQAGSFIELPCEVIRVASAMDEAAQFEKLLGEVDAVLVIAPETGGVLAERCGKIQSNRVVSWNCSSEAIKLCADKLRLYQHLIHHHLPTIPTVIADLNAWPGLERDPFEGFNISNRFVLKPRDGAGSVFTFLIRSQIDWSNAVHSIRDAGKCEHFLLQPYLEGQNLSVGVNINLDGNRIECLPIGEQRLSDDGRFHYRGGLIPAEIPSSIEARIKELIIQTCQTINGLVGYIGFDLLLTAKGDPYIVEINPRLTTAYVGYRRLFSDSLVSFWLSEFQTGTSLKRSNQRVEFTV